MKTVLLTGGIGSGKSVVAAYLQSRGVPVYDSDSRTRALYEGPLTEELEAALGVTLRDPDGHFSKARLSALIFSDPSALAKTEAVVHPRVKEDFLQWLSDLPKDAPFAVMESAIALSKPLFRDLFDAVVVVKAPLESRLKWSTRPEAEMRRRMASQDLDPTAADAVILNDSDIQTLLEKADLAMEKINCHIPKPSASLRPSQASLGPSL